MGTHGRSRRTRQRRSPRPEKSAVVDEFGELTYADLDRRSTLLAKGLHGLGAQRGERLGVACRNHRDFVELTVAAAKAGLGVVYLNTSFAAPQMREVVDANRSRSSRSTTICATWSTAQRWRCQ